jgi:hypothetical protein
MNPRLTVAFPRKSFGKSIHRALSSLEGAPICRVAGYSSRRKT